MRRAKAISLKARPLSMKDPGAATPPPPLPSNGMVLAKGPTVAGILVVDCHHGTSRPVVAVVIQILLLCGVVGPLCPMNVGSFILPPPQLWCGGCSFSQSCQHPSLLKTLKTFRPPPCAPTILSTTAIAVTLSNERFLWWKQH